LDAGSSILPRPQETTMPRVVEGSVESMDPVRHPCTAAATPPSPAHALFSRAPPPACARSPKPAIDLPRFLDLPRALSPWPPSPARCRTLGEMPPPPPPNFSSCARFFRTRTRPLPSSRQIFLPLPRTAPTSPAPAPETHAQLRVLTRRLQIRIPRSKSRYAPKST